MLLYLLRVNLTLQLESISEVCVASVKVSDERLVRTILRLSGP